MVSYELNQNLKAIAGEGSLQDIVFRLIQTAEAHEWIEKLICAAYGFNSRNQKLQSFLQKLSLKKSNDLRAIIENQLECDYDSVEELGTGAFGITYLATAKNQDKYLVIKTIKLEELYKIIKSNNQETLKNFIQVIKSFEKEADILSRFKHSNIVEYYDYFTQKFNLIISFNEQKKKLYSVYELELLFLVMEYIEGESLEDFISKRSVPLEEAEALRYVQQIGDALILVHSQGVLHRDIKPQNIMVRKATFDAVLIDFGIAREFNPTVTQTHTVAFTQGYAPPEQLNQKAKRGNYTDIYGLAATLYYLLTKEPPIHALHRTTQPLDEPKKLNSNISDRVNDAILWGMKLEPSERPQTVQQWLVELLPNETRVELTLPQEVPTQSSILEPSPAEQKQREQEQAEYENKLRCYEQEFAKEVEAEYPLSQTVVQRLKTYQQQLGLNNEDVERVEQPLREPAESKYQEKLRQEAEQQRREQERAEYENKLRCYEKEFAKEVEAEYPLSQTVVQRLKTYQQQLGLNNEDVGRAEQPIREPAEAKYQEKLIIQAEQQRLEQEQAEYENKLRRYEQELYQALAPFHYSVKRKTTVYQLYPESPKQAEYELLQEAINREQEQKKSSPLISNSDDDLNSDRNVDYTRLRDLLAVRNWKDADYETYLVMLKVVGRKKGDWIRDSELLNFPCTDLRTIDNLWVKYSSGRFGFSVQKNIYLEVGGKPDGEYDQEAWKKFGDRVGWRRNGSWIRYEEITYDTTAPVGHSPCNVRRKGFRVVGGFFFGEQYSLPCLASRLVKCNL